MADSRGLMVKLGQPRYCRHPDPSSSQVCTCPLFDPPPASPSSPNTTYRPFISPRPEGLLERCQTCGHKMVWHCEPVVYSSSEILEAERSGQGGGSLVERCKERFCRCPCYVEGKGGSCAVCGHKTGWHRPSERTASESSDPPPAPPDRVPLPRHPTLSLPGPLSLPKLSPHPSTASTVRPRPTTTRVATPGTTSPATPTAPTNDRFPSLERIGSWSHSTATLIPPRPRGARGADPAESGGRDSRLVLREEDGRQGGEEEEEDYWRHEGDVDAATREAEVARRLAPRRPSSPPRPSPRTDQSDGGKRVESRTRGGQAVSRRSTWSTHSTVTDKTPKVTPIPSRRLDRAPATATLRSSSNERGAARRGEVSSRRSTWDSGATALPRVPFQRRFESYFSGDEDVLFSTAPFPPVPVVPSKPLLRPYATSAVVPSAASPSPSSSMSRISLSSIEPQEILHSRSATFLATVSPPPSHPLASSATATLQPGFRPGSRVTIIISLGQKTPAEKVSSVEYSFTGTSSSSSTDASSEDGGHAFYVEKKTLFDSTVKTEGFDEVRRRLRSWTVDLVVPERTNCSCGIPRRVPSSFVDSRGKVKVKWEVVLVVKKKAGLLPRTEDRLVIPIPIVSPPVRIMGDSLRRIQAGSSFSSSSGSVPRGAGRRGEGEVVSAREEGGWMQVEALNEDESPVVSSLQLRYRLDRTDDPLETNLTWRLFLVLSPTVPEATLSSLKSLVRHDFSVTLTRRTLFLPTHNPTPVSTPTAASPSHTSPSLPPVETKLRPRDPKDEEVCLEHVRTEDVHEMGIGCSGTFLKSDLASVDACTVSAGVTICAKIGNSDLLTGLVGTKPGDPTTLTTTLDDPDATHDEEHRDERTEEERRWGKSAFASAATQDEWAIIF